MPKTLRPSITERRFEAAAYVLAVAGPVAFVLSFVWLGWQGALAAGVLWLLGYAQAATEGLRDNYRKHREHVEKTLDARSPGAAPRGTTRPTTRRTTRDLHR